MTPKDAVEFVERHGIALESARGDVPDLVTALVGERPPGSWWSHPRGNEILALTRAVRGSSDVLVCRLLRGKVTYVHRRLWPALVCLANELPAEGLAKIREAHMPSGEHRVEATPFPEWVPEATQEEAARLSTAAARQLLEPWPELLRG